MKDSHSTLPTLCYCSNVIAHGTGGMVVERLSRVIEVFSTVRGRLELGENDVLPLGLWLDADAAERLANDKRESEILNRILCNNRLAVATLNAFPYGRFHDAKVKERVYLPDWRSEERLAYTLNCAEAFTGLPRFGKGPWSISTLPGGYRYGISDAEVAEKEMADNLRLAAMRLEKLREKRGVDISLAVEMEPDCLWETPAEFADFHGRHLAYDETAAKRIGVCYDTCHQELVEGEPGSGLKLLMSRGIPVPKIQLSAAISANFVGDETTDKALTAELAGFAEDTYLHQTRIFRADGKLGASFGDIPPVAELADAAIKTGAGGVAVSHFHMPLYLDSPGGGLKVLKSEAETVLGMAKNLTARVGCMEVETYTYATMPDGAMPYAIEDSIAKELSWTMKKMDAAQRSV